MNLQRKVGVIGVGAMGSRFAQRLAAEGYDVKVWNRTIARAEALAAYGIDPCASPRELAQQVDVLLCMVWDSEALEGVAHGEDGFLAGLAPGATVVDLSTVEPEVSIGVAEAVVARGAAMLDAPVSGSLDAAEAGTVVVMAGGPSAALESVRDVLETLGRVVFHAGEANGSGLALKLAINLQVAIQEVGFGEALSLAESFGISREHAIEVMLQSVIASPMLHYRVPFVLEPPTVIWANAEQLRKDVGYALSRMRGHKAAGVAARDLLDRVIADGRGGREAAELIVEAAATQAQDVAR